MQLFINNAIYSRVQVVEVLCVVERPLHVDDGQHVPVARAASQDHRTRRELAPLLHELGVLLPPRTIVAELKV